MKEQEIIEEMIDLFFLKKGEVFMYKQYYFCERAHLNLIKFLKENNIKYTPDNIDGEGDLIGFSVLSNSVAAHSILKRLEEMKASCPLVFMKYTVAELNKAKLLVMTPQKQSIDIINKEEAYIYLCKSTSSVGTSKARHEEQKGIFSINKEPSMKTQTAFWTEDTGFAEIFADYRVYNLVNENCLTGIEFKRVRDKKGVYSDKLYQMTSPYVLDSNCIGKGYGERKEICHLCGKEQYFIDNTYQLHLYISKIGVESDLYMTERIWGEGRAYPLYIISQRFYQLLKKNKLAGGLTIEPVAELIDILD